MPRNYVLETQSEFDRLEKQSEEPQYNHSAELKNFEIPSKGCFLDAGCGSGVVSRSIAQLHPHLNVVGIDSSPVLLEGAARAAQGLDNLRFEHGDLKSLPLGASSADGFVCRYVLQHMTAPSQKAVLSELFRVTRPGAAGCIIDMDGFLFNLFPLSRRLEAGFARLRQKGPFDFYVGRKLPHALGEAGFVDVRWRIDTLDLQGNLLEAESIQFEQRFDNAGPFLEKLFGSSREFRLFTQEFLAALRAPSTVLFYNKFVVTARKPGLRLA